MSTGSGRIDVAPARRWGLGHTAVPLGTAAMVLAAAVVLIPVVRTIAG